MIKNLTPVEVYPKPNQAKEIVKLAKDCDMDMLLPYYPILFTGAILPDAYQMVYELYKETLKEYEPENICLMGGSTGGNRRSNYCMAALRRTL